MVDFSNLVSRLKKVRVGCVGDFMLDAYTIGTADRISPEAPVPIIRVTKQYTLPGGAGNVCLNIKEMGGYPIAFGRVGADAPGKILLHELSEMGIETRGMIEETSYQTPLKTRVMASQQQVVRIDEEGESALSQEAETAILKRFQEEAPSMDIIVISDYGKGVLTPTLLRKLIACAKEINIPIIVDPKGDDFTRYLGATLIKPNVKESYIAARRTTNTPLETVADELLSLTEADALLITRSEHGSTLYKKNASPKEFPAHIREVKDVTGAGDTVLATLALALASGLSLDESIHLSNYVAGYVIEKVGCAVVSLDQL